MAEIIRCEHVYRTFKTGFSEATVLKDINLSVEEKTLAILRGPSGSGKTTLINLLGALDLPTQGQILFDGKSTASLSETARDRFRRQQVGFIFQTVVLITQMTAFENVDYCLRIAGVPASKRRERVLEVLDLVGLGKRAHHLPFELSGGEQQRIAIACAVAHKPRIIFADEPTAQLDTATGFQVINTFRELIERDGATVIMTTHDPDMIELGDEVFTLRDGEIVNE